MQNVIDKIELMFAALGAFLGWFFGGFDGFLYPSCGNYLCWLGKTYCGKAHRPRTHNTQ